MELIALLIVSTLAGVIDAICGGGGLLQVPALLLLFPSLPYSTVLGTNKLPSLLGTSISSITFFRHIRFNRKVVVPCILLALPSAIFGAYLTTQMSSDFLKPIVVLFMAFIFVLNIFHSKLLAQSLQNKNNTNSLALVPMLFIAVFIGLYDGFFGPGAGLVLIFLFVAVVKLDFLHASAYSKLLNVTTNSAALFYFVTNGHVEYRLALPMAICNMFGSWIGSQLALKKGSWFVRQVFNFMIIIAIIKLGFDSLR